MIKRKRTKGQTTIYKTLRRKLKIEQYETQVLMILIDWFLVFYRHFQQYFSYIMATSFSGWAPEGPGWLNELGSWIT
jgi:hypothetical protein